MATAEIAHLTYTYPERPGPALRDITLTLDRGLQLLTGESGSGKSTLLHSLSGLVPHFYGGRFAGRVIVDGLDTRRASPIDLAARVGLVFQEPNRRFVTTTVVDEIAFGMEVAGMDGKSIRAKVADIVERLELGGVAERSLERLSGGEQQRVALAAALAQGPRILLLDEPTSQLDALSAENVLSWILELRREMGLLALIAEHRLARLIDAAEGMIYLDHGGRLASQGEVGDVLGTMPYGPPLVEAARRIGSPLPLRPQDQEELRARLMSLDLGPVRARPAGPPRLAADGLFHAYNGIPALQDAGIEVRPGEVVAVLGRNGSGKTTLLRCLIGLEKARQGAIWLDGRQIDRQPLADRARDIAFVPQWPSTMLFAETVRQELDLTLRYRGLADDPPHDPEALLAELGLAEVAGRYPRDLAAGEQQRAAIGTMLVAGPRVLLLDESTLGLDALAQARLGALLEAERRRGAAIVVATHDVEFAAAHADTSVILDQGRVVACGPTAETLFSEPALRTSLQRLTGRPRPASLNELPPSPAAPE